MTMKRLLLILLTVAIVGAMPASASWQDECNADHDFCTNDCQSDGPPAPGCIAICNDEYMDCMWYENGDYCPTVQWCPRETIVTPPPEDGGQ